MINIRILPYERRQGSKIMLATIMFLASITILEIEQLFRIFGLVGVLFFGSISIFLLCRLLIEPWAILLISEYGFFDNSTKTSLGFISWEHVHKIYLSSVLGQEIIIVELNQSFATDKKSQVVININLQSSKMKAKDVLRMLQENLEGYRTNKSGTLNLESLDTDLRSIDINLSPRWGKVEREGN